MDPFHSLKTPSPLDHSQQRPLHDRTKCASEPTTVRPTKNVSIHHGRRHSSASHVVTSWWRIPRNKKQQRRLDQDPFTTPANTNDARGCWDSSESMAMDQHNDMPTNKTTWTGKRFTVVTLSTLMFLMAASIGLVSNVFLLAAEDLQKHYYYGHLRFAANTADPLPTKRHLTTLFESYHGPVEDSNAAAGRPKLVIHIGPHKTATTTTQAELTFFQDRLALDDYLYLGRLYYPYDNGERMVLNRTPDSTLQTLFRNMFQKCWRDTKEQCVQDLRDRLHSQFDPRMPNLLISDEALLKLYDDPSDSERNENFVILKDILGRDFDIVIIVTYRRFFEWLPSAKHQKDKPTGEASKTQWPGKSLSRAGIAPRPLLPNDQSVTSVIDEWSREHFLTSVTYATLRELATDTPNFTVQIVHMYHHKLSVRTNFLCHAVPNAPHSCRASHRDDAIRRLDQDETRINARSLGTTTTTTTTTTTIEMEESSVAETMMMMNTPHYPGVFFDALATAAIAYIDTDHWDRQTVSKMLRDHYYASSQAYIMVEQEEERLRHQEPVMDDESTFPQQSTAVPTTTTNPWLLPIVCPSRERLEALLHYSLSLEARMLPKLFQKSATTHVADFWIVATDTFDFCWIDTDTVLRSHDNDDNVAAAGSPWKQHIIDTFLMPINNHTEAAES
jgi:hypothetical protein